MNYTAYNQAVNNYTVSGFIEVANLCNGFTCVNVGDTIAEVNGQILYPGVPGVSLGDSVTIGGNFGEIYKGTIKLSFTLPLGAAPNVQITQKFYNG